MPEDNLQYFRKRLSEEQKASRTAATAVARSRHQQFAALSEEAISSEEKMLRINVPVPRD